MLACVVNNSYIRFSLREYLSTQTRNAMIVQLLEQFSAERSIGGGAGHRLDLINRPPEHDGAITPDRRHVFKAFNYQFHV